jgi:hypothetical protein
MKIEVMSFIHENQASEKRSVEVFSALCKKYEPCNTDDMDKMKTMLNKAFVEHMLVWLSEIPGCNAEFQFLVKVSESDSEGAHPGTKDLKST